MTITGQPSESVLDTMLTPQTTRNDIAVAVLKKAQDVDKQQGEAMVEMLEQSAVPSQGLDVYA